MLTSLQEVEERSSFIIANVTDTTFYVCILNDRPKDILVYEQDPKMPQVRPFALPGNSSVRINLLLHPELDLYFYRRYKASLIAATLTIKAFETEEEAQEMPSVPCLFASQISVKAVVGLIGISSSDPKIDFGSVSESILEANVTVRNRSSHIPLDFLCSCSEGLSVEPQSFTLLGQAFQQSQQDLTLRFRPSAAGTNEAKLQLLHSGPVPYTKTIEVVAFVDPKIIATDLPKNAKNIDCAALGSMYVVGGRPVVKKVHINLTNISTSRVSVELGTRKVIIPSRRSVQWTFDFPMTDDFYNPDEPKFSHRLCLKSATTSRILKVIDIIGEFVVSMGALATDTISLGRFGRINNWKCGKGAILIQNKANIELQLATSSPNEFFKLPDRVIVIKPLAEYYLPLVPMINNCQEQGEKSSVITFTNLNNPANVMRCTVTFDIRHSFLQFDRLIRSEDDSWMLVLSKLNQVVEGDVPGHSAANAWFRVTNRLDIECMIDITTEVLIQGINIELFHRKGDVQIRSLDLQSNESAELRVKVIVSPAAAESLVYDDTHLFARLLFSAEGAQAMVVNAVFQINPPRK
jgi:hypothetical protein